LWCGVVRVVEIVVIFIVTAKKFFSDCRFLGVFIFLDTETSAKSAIEPDPAYSIHTRDDPQQDYRKERESSPEELRSQSSRPRERISYLAPNWKMTDCS
jgi:hypothetical protein